MVSGLEKVSQNSTGQNVCTGASVRQTDKTSLGKSKIKPCQNTFALHKVSKNVRSERVSTRNNKNKPVVHGQVNRGKVSAQSSSVTGVSKTPQAKVQIELKNRFEILHDIVDQESCQDQGAHSFPVRNKHAQFHNKDEMAHIVSDTNYLNTNQEIIQKFESNSPQKTVDIDSNSQNSNTRFPVGDIIDLGSHVTDSQLVINGNCEPDNKTFLKNNPNNVSNVVGDSNKSGMCVEKQKCIAQTGGYFGFVPALVFAHALVQSSGTHNYRACRIPVNSHLNIDRWAYYLKDYWDQQIVDLLHYGFPLDFCHNSSLTSTHVNHSSALADIEHVRQYVEEELQHQAIIGPFDTVPCSLHLSQLMTRAK